MGDILRARNVGAVLLCFALVALTLSPNRSGVLHGAHATPPQAPTANPRSNLTAAEPDPRIATSAPREPEEAPRPAHPPSHDDAFLREFAPGRVQPLLFDLRYDDVMRHRMAIGLVNAVPPRPRPEGNVYVIVGLGPGDGVITRETMPPRWRVFIFEPFALFTRRFVAQFRRDQRERMRVFEIAAHNTSGSVGLQYENMRKVVPQERVDTYVKDHVYTASLDTQGTELNILKGMSNIFDGFGADIVYCEMIALNPNLLDLLQFLDRLGFVIFDFVPIGQPRNSRVPAFSPAMTKEFAPYEPRPSGFAEWVDHFNMLSRSKYKWLQTDIMAINRSFLTRAHIDNLAHVCDDFRERSRVHSFCWLKRLLADEELRTQL
eukprot:TRINITY_DN43844_c0_g1_i1.p1 TRINITY_DN43844_c0_g1~~TRINITY_DN43844_c0_g1_i1.p1  ORF type:complete len:392 (+),score=55.87 TRINITY_DN43844_c0_g1_i1:51-1178(+)